MPDSVLTAAALAAALLAPHGRAQPDDVDQARRPNVLFYLIDTCRADRMSVFGHHRRTTPFLERLAERSVVFERCYAQAPWTKPSMGALLTSRYPSELGIHTLLARLPSSLVTFPEVLEEAGYHTAGFSSNPLMGRFSNYTQGFSHFVESVKINRANPIQFASGSAAKLNAAVFSWLDGRDDPGPVFLYVHSVDPHEEYAPAPEYLRRFADPARLAGYRVDWRKLLGTRPPVPGNRLVQWNFDRVGVDPVPFVAYGRDLYDADILANDHQIEALWQRLQDQGWGQDLILVLTSDHGEEFFEHGGTSHGYSLYDEMIHVPLLIHAPGRLPLGRRVARPVRLIDVYPTLLDLLGLQAPGGLRGRSLLPLLRDAERWEDEPVFAEMTEDAMGRRVGSAQGVALSVRSGRWRYTLNLGSPAHQERPRHELYDVQADPGETRNLAGERADLVARFERQVMQWSAGNLGLRVEVEQASAAPDPETIEQLRQLGYVGKGAPEAALPDVGERLPLLARAVLEGDPTWQLFALDPSAPPEEQRELQFSAFGELGRAAAADEHRAALLALLYEGIAGADGPPSGGFSPRHGVRAHHRGHTADLVICAESGAVEVFVDAVGRYGSGARPLATVSMSRAVADRLRALFAQAGL